MSRSTNKHERWVLQYCTVLALSYGLWWMAGGSPLSFFVVYVVGSALIAYGEGLSQNTNQP